MLCEICQKREATVHLTSCTPGEGSVGHRNFCEDCFPFGSMSHQEREAALRELFGVQSPDEPGKPGESRDSR